MNIFRFACYRTHRKNVNENDLKYEGMLVKDVVKSISKMALLPVSGTNNSSIFKSTPLSMVPEGNGVELDTVFLY